MEQSDSSSEDEDSDSENEERSSASESDSSLSESVRRRVIESSSDESEDTEDGSADDTSEDEVEDADEMEEIHEGHVCDEAHSDDDAHGLDSRVEVRVHVHEAKQLTPMDGSTSDPYAYVTCFGHSERTKTASKGTAAIWDEELQFSGTVQELAGSVARVAVWDEDYGADDLIGSFDFDLEDVRKRPHKEVSDQCQPCLQKLLLLSSLVENIWFVCLHSTTKLGSRCSIPLWTVHKVKFVLVLQFSSQAMSFRQGLAVNA